MPAILLSLLGALRSAVRARNDLIIENLALRQQLAVCKRHGPCRRLAHADRPFWIALSRFWSRWREVLVVVKPATVVGWHRWAFRRFWTWRSRRRHLSLGKDAPDPRAVHPPSMGKIVEIPEVGGLHHRYARLAA
jgi:hypothetical protein